MHDNKFLTPPVCENDRRDVGLVTVMDVIYGCGRAKGWRSLFSSSLDMDDVSDAASVHSGIGSATGSAACSTRSKNSVVGRLQDARPVSKLQPKVPLISSVDDSILNVTFDAFLNVERTCFLRYFPGRQCEYKNIEQQLLKIYPDRQLACTCLVYQLYFVPNCRPFHCAG